jgi:hypothetical protein
MVFANNTEIFVTFLNEREAKLLWWHTKCRKKDGILRHPVDSPE